MSDLERAARIDPRLSGEVVRRHRRRTRRCSSRPASTSTAHGWSSMRPAASSASASCRAWRSCRPTLKTDELILRAPGMLALHVAIDRVEERAEVEVWNDRVAAYDMGALCAQWFSDFLGRPLRLARFDPEAPRLADREWTGAIEAENAFQDGFPLLVASTASLDEVNRRLATAGEAPVTMARFRPNLVLGGLDAHGEDQLDEIVFAAAEGPVRLKLVKPCARCPIPDVDPATGDAGHAVGDVLAQLPRRSAHGRRAHLRDERRRRRRRRPHARAPACAATRELRVRLNGGRRCSASRPGSCSRSACSSGARPGTRSPTSSATSRPRSASPCASRSPARRVLALCRWRGVPLRIRSPTTRALALQGVFLYGVSYVCVYHAERFVPRGWSRSATRPRRCSPASARRCCSARRSARRFVVGGVLGLGGVALIFWPEIARPSGGERAALGALAHGRLGAAVGGRQPGREPQPPARRAAAAGDGLRHALRRASPRRSSRSRSAAASSGRRRRAGGSRSPTSRSPARC